MWFSTGERRNFMSPNFHNPSEAYSCCNLPQMILQAQQKPPEDATWSLRFAAKNSHDGSLVILPVAPAALNPTLRRSRHRVVGLKMSRIQVTLHPSCQILAGPKS